MMQQTEFRFYDKEPEQLTLDVTQEQPQPDYSNSIAYDNGGLYFINSDCSDYASYTVNLNNVVVGDDERPSLIKRILLKQLGIKYK